MTRINVVPVEELCREHLVAEYRELPRVFALVKAAADRGESPDDPRNPTEYTLGPGHIRFFYPRMEYICIRCVALGREMKRRGYNPKYVGLPAVWLEISDEWYETPYVPTEEALALNRARIAERLSAMKGYQNV